MFKEVANGFLLTSVKDRVRTIQFNRPQKKNALAPEVYLEITRILNEDATNDAVLVTIFTGVGEYYTSGNDVTSKLNDTDQDFEEGVRHGIKIIQNFIAAIINYPKILVAVVNGPAIGIGVTTLPLFDIVYASDRATFSTPFVNLGLCPEGCSSYLFPRIMGRSKASEMLMLGHKMCAQEAYQFGLVSQVIPHADLGKLFEKLQTYGGLPMNSIKAAKKLITANLNDTLHKTNDREMTTLTDCFHNDEFFEAIIRFTTRKSKL